jgi:diguanylate cyclase (GGDEF)-like protein
VSDALIHPRELDRLAILHATGLVDSEPEPGYGDAVQLAVTLCDTPVAAISFVDQNHLWFKARIGFDIDHAPRHHGLCAHVVANEATLVVEDARLDPRFAQNPFVTGPFGLVHYAGAVVYSPNDLPIGTLCVVDRVPRRLSDAQIAALEALARQVGALVAYRLDRNLMEQYAVELSEARLLLEVQAAELEEANQSLALLASTDALTGIANRRMWMQRFEEVVVACSEANPTAVIMMDIDHFKGYNDAFGHPEGDIVLRQVAELANTALRPRDLLGRYGGEEFCAVLPGTTADEAVRLAERIRRMVETMPWLHRPVSLSLGVAMATDPADANALIARADEALYESKRHGRNRTTLSRRGN